tara:strand:+ start:350 stop:1132 length:783 start_codon:yes stop_codon:yes gene_type:complete
MSVNGTKVLALNSSSNGYVPLKTDASGRLEISTEDNATAIVGYLDNTIGDINNTGAIGDGQSVLRNTPLGYDRANGKGVSFLVDSSGRQSTILTGNSNSGGSGTNYHITCDSGGRMYVNSDLGIPVNALTDGGANQSLRCIDGSLRVATKKTTGEWLASGAIADDNYSSALDCSSFKNIRLMGKWTGSLTNMPILGSQTTSGTYYALTQQEWITQQSVDIGGSTEYHIEANITNVPNFIKLYNQTGGSKTLEVDYVGISN